MTTAKPFVAQQFTDTPSASAGDKARAANAIAAFVAVGCPRSKFTSLVYERLRNMFGHIAHYDRDGFYATWFATPERRAAWAAYVRAGGAFGGPFGQPQHSWCDVERALMDWLAASGIGAQIERAGAAAVEAAEREQLARLQAKYGSGK